MRTEPTTYDSSSPPIARLTLFRDENGNFFCEMVSERGVEFSATYTIATQAVSDVLSRIGMAAKGG